MTARIRRRRRVRPVLVELTAAAELDARLDGRPADVLVALYATDREHNTLHRLRVESAVRFARFAREVADPVAAERLRGIALGYVSAAQEMRLR